jgi:hypothetical protein
LLTLSDSYLHPIYHGHCNDYAYRSRGRAISDYDKDTHVHRTCHGGESLYYHEHKIDLCNEDGFGYENSYCAGNGGSGG